MFQLLVLGIKLFITVQDESYRLLKVKEISNKYAQIQ